MMAAELEPMMDGGLPPIRGRVQTNAPLTPFTWFRAGGRAEFLVRPADAADLATLLRGLPATTPVQVIGAASNLIVRDGGLPGVTIRLARGFSSIVPGSDGVIAGAAALATATLARHARRHAVKTEFVLIVTSLGAAPRHFCQVVSAGVCPACAAFT